MNLNMIIFIVVQFVSICISTAKYSITGTAKPIVATIVNAISVAVGNFATILLVREDATIGVIVTFISTCIGVPLTRWVIDKFTPDKLFIFTATIENCPISKAADIRKKLKTKYNIHSNYQSIVDNEIYSFSIYAKTKKDSTVIVEELKKLKAHYHVIECR